MNGNEREDVARTLDELRGALAAYIDQSMTNCLGDNWDDAVAEENAQRRSDRRKFPIVKNDLAVMLKALIHRRIEPWSTLRTYPRVRAYASEVLTLRNLHAHGDECVGELSRLVDTGNRLLVALHLPVPAGLDPAVRAQASPPTDLAVARAGEPEFPLSRIDAEVDALGDAGRRFGEILVQASELTTDLSRMVMSARGVLNPAAPDWDAFMTRYVEGARPAGAKVIDLLDATERLEAALPATCNPGLWVLAAATRCELLNPTLESAARLHVIDLEKQRLELVSARLQQLDELRDSSRIQEELAAGVDEDPNAKSLDLRIDEANRLIPDGKSSREHLLELIQVATKFEGATPLANLFLGTASVRLAGESRNDEGWTDEALRRIDDAISRLRFEAGMEPGSAWETMLVCALRMKGEICSDLGRADDAVGAFARAGEIIDRYPAADPTLGS